MRLEDIPRWTWGRAGVAAGAGGTDSSAIGVLSGTRGADSPPANGCLTR
jgi:hypothetical protein